MVFFDTSEANGATEVWPGTHNLPELGRCNKFTESQKTIEAFATMAERRRESVPPVRLCIPKGAVAFRDARCAHRGVPNHGPVPRPMLALQYASTECRGDLVVNSTQLISRMSADKRGDGAVQVRHSGTVQSSGQTRLVFSASARMAFAEESPWGIDRNVLFIDGDVDQSGKPLPLGLPMELSADVNAGDLPPWSQAVFQKYEGGFEAGLDRARAHRQRLFLRAHAQMKAHM